MCRWAGRGRRRQTNDLFPDVDSFFPGRLFCHQDPRAAAAARKAQSDYSATAITRNRLYVSKRDGMEAEVPQAGRRRKGEIVNLSRLYYAEDLPSFPLSLSPVSLSLAARPNDSEKRGEKALFPHGDDGRRGGGWRPSLTDQVHLGPGGVRLHHTAFSLLSHARI